MIYKIVLNKKMGIFKLILYLNCIFFYFIFCQKNNIKNIPKWQSSLIDLETEIVKQIFDYSNSSMIEETVLNNPQCGLKITSLFTHPSSLIDILQFSGKDFMDTGYEEECLEDPQNRYIYLFLRVKFDKNKLLKYAKQTANDILFFTDQETFFIGLCLWKECKEFYSKFFDKKNNQVMFHHLYKKYAVQDITIQKDPNLFKPEINLGFYLLIYTTLFYLILRVIILFIGNILVLIENKRIDASEVDSKDFRQTIKSRESEYLLVEEEGQNDSKGKLNNNNRLDQKNYFNTSTSYQNFNKNFYDFSNHDHDRECDRDSESISENSSSISSDYITKVWSNKDAYDKEIKICISDIKKCKKFKKYSDHDSSDFDNHLSTETELEFTSSRKVTLLSNITIENSKCQIFKQKFLNLFKTLSITQSFQYLFNVKNEIYDDSNLEVISGIRSFLLFWITVERLIVYIYSLSYDIGNITFYSSWGFVFIKYACFAVESTIFLDGFLYTYRLMSFLKRSNDYSFKNFMRFFFNVIQRVVPFTIIFFIITVYLDDVANIFSKTYVFGYLYELLLKEKCIENPYTLLIPFYLQYFNCEETDYYTCLKYVFHCVNESYCMLFTVVLFYFLFKIKSKKFEQIFIGVVMINIIFSFIYYTDLFKGINDSTYKFYNLAFILGEVRLMKQPHLLYYVFFIGINCGLVYFYFIDSISDPVKYQKENNYIPFDYNFSIMKKIIKLSKTRLYLIGLTALLFQILICCSYNIMLKLKNEANNLLLDFNSINILIFLYEKKINIILFAIMTLVLIFSSEKLLIKYLLKSRIFITFSRISFPFICLDIFVYLFFTMYDIKIYWNYQNIFIISFALYCILIFFNFILSSLFELPVRIVYKKYMRGQVNKNIIS
jgi:hypothetical protein